jgi:GTP-binding protein LepA
MACETALLLVDAAQGAQAQTMAHWRTAKGLGKRIIPIINKIDLPSADPDAVELQMETLLGITEEPLRISAKAGIGIKDV